MKPRFILITVSNLNSIQQRLLARKSQTPPGEILPEETIESNYGTPIQSGFRTPSVASTPLSPEDKKASAQQFEMNLWISKANAAISSDNTEQNFFDRIIVNDDLDRAYAELKDFCLSAYWHEGAEED